MKFFNAVLEYCEQPWEWDERRQSYTGRRASGLNTSLVGKTDCWITAAAADDDDDNISVVSPESSRARRPARPTHDLR